MRFAGKEFSFGGCVFRVCENVYEPSDDSFLFAENLAVKRGDRVLDVGTGCGLLGVVAAKKASFVVGVDVNRFAVRCALANAKLNGVSDKMMFVAGDLFSALSAVVRFDLVLFNAPYLPVEKGEGLPLLERAWSGGAGGREVIDRFVVGVHERLERGGKALLLQSTLADVDETLEKFGEQGLRAKIIAEKSLPFFESIVLVEAVRLL